MAPVREISGKLDAAGSRFVIVVSRFNAKVTDGLLEGALAALARHGAPDGAITVVRVPGAFEIPHALRLAASANPSPTGLIALGALIRGRTPHFEHLAAVVTRAIEEVSADSGIPVANGVITCDTVEQAIERAGGGRVNKGDEAAATAIEMASLSQLISSR